MLRCKLRWSKRPDEFVVTERERGLFLLFCWGGFDAFAAPFEELAFTISATNYARIIQMPFVIFLRNDINRLDQIVAKSTRDVDERHNLIYCNKYMFA